MWIVAALFILELAFLALLCRYDRILDDYFDSLRQTARTLDTYVAKVREAFPEMVQSAEELTAAPGEHPRRPA